MIVYPEKAGLSKAGKWFKVTLGQNYKDKSRVNGDLYFPVADTEKIVRSPILLISLKDRKEECDYSARKVDSSPNFAKYVLEDIGNDFSTIYVPKSMEGDEVLELDMSKIVFMG